MSWLEKLIAPLSGALPTGRLAAQRDGAVALLDRFGGDVTLATRWCNAQMRRAEAERAPDRARQALALRRACGVVWAERIGARPVAAATPSRAAQPSTPLRAI